MTGIESDKEKLRDNLKQAVRNCKKLKIGHRVFNTSFCITTHSFLDFTEEKYEDGIHSYKIDSTVSIKDINGNELEERCDIHFDAHIIETNAIIMNGMVFADRDFIPHHLETKL